MRIFSVRCCNLLGTICFILIKGSSNCPMWKGHQKGLFSGFCKLTYFDGWLAACVNLPMCMRLLCV